MLYTMLFARYPFERPEDKKLNQHDRLQRILHRIIKVGGQGLPRRSMHSYIIPKVAGPAPRPSVLAAAKTHQVSCRV
jgi:hypothetical protein